MNIEILGSGCAKCLELERRVKEVVEKNNLSATVEHVYDIKKIIERNVYSTPALAVDGKIILTGKLASVEEITDLLVKR